MEDSGTGDSITDEHDRAGRRRAAGRRAGAPRPQGLARYARPALIAGAVIAVVCVALLVIIFFLDSFNATVYSVGGKNVQDATDEAQAIRETYAAARLGGIVFLIAGILLAAAGGRAAVPAPERRRPTTDEDDGEDVDFEDLAGWRGDAAAARPQAAGPCVPVCGHGRGEDCGRGLPHRSHQHGHACPAGPPDAHAVTDAPAPLDRQWACSGSPAVGALRGHAPPSGMCHRPRQTACPGMFTAERISGTRLDRVLTIYIESSLALSLGGC